MSEEAERIDAEAEVRADEHRRVKREVARRLRDVATRLGRSGALHHAPPVLDRLADELLEETT